MATPAASGSKWIRPDKRLAIYARDGWACVYCQASDTLTLDHIVSVEKAGRNNHETNLITCCLSCNSAKKDLHIRAWYAVLRGLGHDVVDIQKRIRRFTRRKLDRIEGKRLFQIRKAA